MTRLSVNLNKIALLRNARGRDFPSVTKFAERFMALGVQGITVHPRQDERHITRQDTLDLGHLLSKAPHVEFNVEGYPSESFLALVERVKPDQCTLVPDKPDQLTSDHGWDAQNKGEFLKTICQRLQKAGVRVSLFIDPDIQQINAVPATGAERIELYTEAYAAAYHSTQRFAVLQQYREAAQIAKRVGLGVNAGHDLDLHNLSEFLSIPDILEVSIGHALTVECLEQGIESVTRQYLDICRLNNGSV